MTQERCAESTLATFRFIEVLSQDVVRRPFAGTASRFRQAREPDT